MAVWSFLCYDPSGERMGFHAWYDALPPALMAEVDRALDLLSREKRWVEAFYKELDGACEGLARHHGQRRLESASAYLASRTCGSESSICSSASRKSSAMNTGLNVPKRSGASRES